jgi:hypothetical protein
MNKQFFLFYQVSYVSQHCSVHVVFTYVAGSSIYTESVWYLQPCLHVEISRFYKQSDDLIINIRKTCHGALKSGSRGHQCNNDANACCLPTSGSDIHSCFGVPSMRVVSINMCTSHQQHTAIRFRGPVTHACSDNI